jgi:hypothetical protein
MARVVAVLLTLAGLPSQASAQTVIVVATDPREGIVLAPGAPLYVRLTYTSSVPVRFQAHGYRSGRVVQDGARMNPAPSYPAGTGEAIAWVAFGGPATIDEVRIEVSDARWQPRGVERVPVAASWHAGGFAPPRAAWVSTLSDAQQQMTSDPVKPAGETEGFLWTVLPLLIFLSIAGYFILQVRAWRKWKGWWRVMGLLPLVASVPIVIYTGVALAAGSNLWPLLMIFTLPFAFLYLAVITAARRIFGMGSGVLSRGHRRRQTPGVL